MKTKKILSIYNSFDDENKAEYNRLASMTPEQRWNEFSILQERVWGVLWTSTPIEKTASYEILKW